MKILAKNKTFRYLALFTILIFGVSCNSGAETESGASGTGTTTVSPKSASSKASTIDCISTIGNFGVCDFGISDNSALDFYFYAPNSVAFTIQDNSLFAQSAIYKRSGTDPFNLFSKDCSVGSSINYFFMQCRASGCTASKAKPSLDNQYSCVEIDE